MKLYATREEIKELKDSWRKLKKAISIEFQKTIIFKVIFIIITTIINILKKLLGDITKYK